MRSIRGLYRYTVDILLFGRYNHVSTSYKSYNCIIFNTKLTIYNKIIWLTLSVHVNGSQLLLHFTFNNSVVVFCFQFYSQHTGTIKGTGTRHFLWSSCSIIVDCWRCTSVLRPFKFTSWFTYITSTGEGHICSLLNPWFWYPCWYIVWYCWFTYMR